MSYQISVDVDKSRLDNIITAFSGNLAEIGRKIGEAGYESARMHAPVRTGLLKSSIRLEVPGGDILAMVGISGEDCSYAIYQEFGTYKMAAHPFITPAGETIANIMGDSRLWMTLLY